MKCSQQLISDDKLRIVLENNICREEGPQPNCFCIPMAYAWTALSEVRNVFVTHVNSSIVLLEFFILIDVCLAEVT